MLFACLVLISGKLLEFGMQGKACGHWRRRRKELEELPGRTAAAGKNYEFSAT
jgi:hypothetical protein